MKVMRCSDCNTIIKVEANENKEEETLWAICDRCNLKRLGYRGAKSYSELGIY